MNVQDRGPRNGPSRREFLALGVGALAVASVPWAARARQGPVRRSIPVMGTVAEVVVVHRDPRYAQAAIDAAFAELRAVEATMSRFRADSDVGRVNRAAAGTPVAVSAATAAVLAEALRWADASHGGFDPALGRAVALWDTTGRTRPPAADEVGRYAGRRMYRQVELDAQGDRSRVLLHDAELALDLGGIAKGYAVDRAVDALRAWGIAHALVNAGGDLHALGRSPGGDPWRIGVQSPTEAGTIAATLELEDAAVATSGDYRQGFDHAGRRYHHLLDPRTGEPRRTAMRSLTVQASSCLVADAAATTLFGRADAEAARVLASAAPAARVIHQL